jgi:hypothetical protein
MAVSWPALAEVKQYLDVGSVTTSTVRLTTRDSRERWLPPFNG